MDSLDIHQIAYEKTDGRSDAVGMEELFPAKREPTLVWDGEVLADFAVDELEEFWPSDKIHKHALYFAGLRINSAILP
jgi:hypothetical protein